MDIDSSLKIAHSLSNEFGGYLYLAVKHFQDIVEYCMNHEDFHFEKADCGKLAAKVSKQGENSKEVMSKPFIAGFEFLVSVKRGHTLT